MTRLICLHDMNNMTWCHNVEKEWIHNFKSNRIPTRMQVILRQEPTAMYLWIPGVFCTKKVINT